jgi:TonB family protein
VIFFHDSTIRQVQEKIYTVSEVKVKPQPEKGLNDFYDKWSKKVVYPKEAIEKNIQGMVFIQFIVNEDGKISEAEVKQGLGHGCDEAALKGFHDAQVLWHPGIKNDTTVKVKMVVPFAFRIMKKNNP